MSTIFNLKTAMGWDWQVYRQTGWQWWNYDEIISGQNPEWNEAVKTTPSLKGALVEITHDKLKYEDVFRYRYGVSDEEMRHIFFVFVGYHPAYGAYTDFIGPYVGSKPSDRLNKYAYFIRRFQKANTNETLMAFNDMVKRNFSEFADILGPDDFKAVVLSEINERRGTKQWKHEKKEYKSVDPNTPEGKRFYKESPIMGRGSYFDPNAKGIYKIMLKASKDGNLESALKNSISKAAKEVGISDQEALKMLQTNDEFTRKVFDAFRNVQLRAKQMGGPAAEKIKPLPDFYVMKKPNIGSQRTDALKTRPIQFSILNLRKEILEAVVTSKIEDPTKLSEFLNAKRSQERIKKLKAKGQFTPQVVSYWLNEINKSRSVKDAKGRFSRRKSYAEVLGETDKEIKILWENKDKKEEGFNDLEETMFMCSLFHAEVPPEYIDPNTRAKMISFEPKGKPAIPSKTRSKKPEESQLSFVTPTFTVPEGVPIITSTQLSEWRVQRGAEYEGVLGGDIEEPIEKDVEREKVEKVEDIKGDKEAEEATEEIKGKPGQLKKPVTKKTPVPNILVPPKTTPAIPSKKIPKIPRPMTPVTEEVDIAEEGTSRSRTKKVMTNALLSLIRIAKELDEEGKSEASESVHKVIRKYQEGIKRC